MFHGEPQGEVRQPKVFAKTVKEIKSRQMEVVPGTRRQCPMTWKGQFRTTNQDMHYGGHRNHAVYTHSTDVGTF